MGELIRIGAEEGQPGLGATIDTTGAWVTSFSLGKDHIFFPKDLIATSEGDTKARGGSHICSLIFGPDPEGKGPQHGYARGVEWAVTGSDLRYVRLRHIASEGEYAGIQHDLGIQVIDIDHLKILATNMSVTNNGNREIMIAPGFHPYFSGPARFDEGSKVADKDTRVERKGNYTLRTVQLLSGITVNMVAVNCPESTVWSDMPEEFHCVEPSALPLSAEPGPEDVLRPGEFKEYAVSFVLNLSESSS